MGWNNVSVNQRYSHEETTWTAHMGDVHVLPSLHCQASPKWLGQHKWLPSWKEYENGGFQISSKLYRFTYLKWWCKEKYVTCNRSSDDEGPFLVRYVRPDIVYRTLQWSVNGPIRFPITLWGALTEALHIRGRGHYTQLFFNEYAQSLCVVYICSSVGPINPDRRHVFAIYSCNRAGSGLFVLPVVSTISRGGYPQT